jgi:DNA-binding transcriptional LysR family regulator
VNNWLVLHDAVRGGAGVAVLPCYLGDVDASLRRIGPVLKDVWADQWLLVHRDLRELARVRRVMDALVALFQEQKPLLEGKSGARYRLTNDTGSG